MNPKIAFFGTDSFSVRIAQILSDRGFTPALVVTPQDKPVGKKKIITAVPLKVWAGERNIPVLDPASLKEFAFGEHTPDLMIVASYGKIIPKRVLDIPQYGALNIHPSKLPLFRGPSPIESSMIADEKETAVAIIKMDEQMDHGPIVAMKDVTIKEWRPYQEIEDMFADIGGTLMADILPEYLSGNITPKEQEHDKATYTYMITKPEGKIDLSDDPYLNYRKICAYAHFPRAFFIDEFNQRIIITQASFENGQLTIERVIPEGSKEMSWEAYQNGIRGKQK